MINTYIIHNKIKIDNEFTKKIPMQYILEVNCKSNAYIMGEVNNKILLMYYLYKYNTIYYFTS